ncbi:Hypothetical predicted protein [Podarcis lilfordi]|uniref:Uncharacterized protein n=1 Tax=Podarcis lilfordi TaxID=74358 RepID=A0AA35KV60_9SAUR|nr:Hypothetical predicted protein [Podarcis lilfordi]
MATDWRYASHYSSIEAVPLQREQRSKGGLGRASLQLRCALTSRFPVKDALKAAYKNESKYRGLVVRVLVFEEKTPVRIPARQQKCTW